MDDGNGDDHRRGGGEGADVDEPAPAENRSDDAPLSRLLESTEHVGHRSGWRFDPVGPNLVQQPKQFAISGQLGLAPQACPDMLDDDFVGRGGAVKDRGQYEGDLGARHSWRTSPGTAVTRPR